MKPVIQDEVAMLKAAKRKFNSSIKINYVRYDTIKGHLWAIQGMEQVLGVGWFDCDGIAKFSYHPERYLPC